MELNGVLLIDKPKGFTSFDVIAKMRGILQTKKIGHSGTLDPMATGVLVLFVGHGTKAIDFMDEHVKRYRGKIKLGLLTDTLDITGEIQQEEQTCFTQEQVQGVISKFLGEITQIPPMYSAIKVDGKKLYQLARAGKTIERKERTIKVHGLTISDFQEKEQTFWIDVTCSKGTYIRTLANDIGQALGSYGCLLELERLSSDGFELSECVTLKQVQEKKEEGRLSELFLSVEQMFSYLPSVFLQEKETYQFLHGVKLPVLEPEFSVGQKVKIYDFKQRFMATAMVNEDKLLKTKGFFVTRGLYENCQ